MQSLLAPAVEAKYAARTAKKARLTTAAAADESSDDSSVEAVYVGPTLRAPEQKLLSFSSSGTVDLTAVMSTHLPALGLPFALASNPRFREFLAAVVAKVSGRSRPVRFASRNTIAEAATAQASAYRTYLTAKLAEDAVAVNGKTARPAIEMDIWSNLGKDSFTVMSVTRINASFECYTDTLAVAPMGNHAHTIPMVRATLVNVMKQYGMAPADTDPNTISFDEHVVSITTDNGSNMNVVGDETWLRRRCAAHTLALCVTSATSDATVAPAVTTAFDTVKRVISLFSTSVKRMASYKDSFAAVYGPSVKVLLPIFYVPTRWGSFYMASCRYLIMSRVIAHMPAADLGLTAEGKSALCADMLTANNVLRHVVAPLAPFHAWTQKLSENVLGNIANVKRAVDELQAATTVTDATPASVRPFVATLNAQLRTRFAEVISGRDRGVFIAFFLNPVTARTFYKSRPGESTSDATARAQRLKDVLETLESDCPASAIAKGGGAMAAVLGTSSKLQQQVGQYLAKLDDVDEDLDVAGFWRSNKKPLDLLYQLAREYLAQRATSAECERQASLAGLLSSRYRQRMLTSRLADLTLITSAAVKAHPRPARHLSAELEYQRALRMLDGDAVPAVPEAGAPAAAAAAGAGAAAVAPPPPPLPVADDGEAFAVLVHAGLLDESGEVDAEELADAAAAADDDDVAEVRGAGHALGAAGGGAGIAAMLNAAAAEGEGAVAARPRRLRARQAASAIAEMQEAGVL